MLVKYGQAVLLAALMVLVGNTARAEEAPARSGDCCADCCKDGKCDKAACKNCVCGKEKEDGKGCACCKGKDGGKNCECCKGKACGKDCECCKNKTCACCKGKECGCGKDKECCKNCSCCQGKECACGKGKAKCACSKGACECCGCARVNKLKRLLTGHPVIVVLPGPMTPVCAPCPIAAPCMIHHVPAGMTGCGAPLPPPPPMLTPPGLPVPTMTTPIMPPQTAALPAPPAPACCPCPVAACPVCVAPPKGGLSVERNTTPASPGLDVENCVSILGLVGDLCCAHMRPASLPAICLSSLGMLMEWCPQPTAQGAPLPTGQYLQHPPQYMPPSTPFALEREPASREATLLPPPRPECPVCPVASVPLPQAVPCAIPSPTPAPALKVRIAAKPYSDQLEMCVGDDSCMSCKRMVVKVGGSELTLTRVDGQIRVRGEELKAKANCVGTDRKGGLILEGEVVLSYKKDGQSARISADHVELDLATGSVTVKSAGKSSCTPVRYDAIVP